MAAKIITETIMIPRCSSAGDWYWWSPLPIGSHIMNAERYPDPKAMINELHGANMHAMISIWPVFGNGTKNFDALKKQRLFDEHYMG